MQCIYMQNVQNDAIDIYIYDLYMIEQTPMHSEVHMQYKSISLPINIMNMALKELCL